MSKSQHIKTNYYYLLIDIVIMTVFFLFVMWFMPATINHYLPKYTMPFLLFCLIRGVIGLIFSKYKDLRKQVIGKSMKNVTIADLISVCVAYFFIYLNPQFRYSPKILDGLVIATYIFELLIIGTLFAFKKSMEADYQTLLENAKKDEKIILPREMHSLDLNSAKKVEEIINAESGSDVLKYLIEHSDLKTTGTLVLSTTTRFNIINQVEDYYNTIINLKRINDVKYINKFFEAINSKLPHGGLYISCVETKNLRKNRILKKLPKPFNYIYYFFDFLIKRVAPKFVLTKKLYFFITNGNNRVISKAETLGRLYSCGFELLNEQIINGYMYFTVVKIKEPLFPEDPTYGPFVKLKRVGKDGKIIDVYKMRTMHPYAEYLHDYILKTNGYSEIGKPADDFRLTRWGKIMRRYWLDELPQLINVFRGEMKLVGARPLSQRVYNDYPDDIKKIRNKYKPGCFPPYVALLMQNMDASIEAERIYLLEKEKRPYTTDIKYFWKAVYNIITNKIRSA